MSDARLIIPKHTIELLGGEIKGQGEMVPLPNEDYLLQMVVSLDKVTEDVNTLRKDYRIKQSGEFLLTRIPKQGEPTDESQLLPG